MMSVMQSLLSADDSAAHAPPVAFVPDLASAHEGLLAADYLALNIRDLFGDFEADDSRPDTQPLNPHDSRPVTTSVLLNTWNHARYIEDCIESLLVQTVLPTEIIVYDDGSEDDTVSRLRQYSSRITLIEGKALSLPSHLRQANAVQTAFGRSTGQLVFLLDGDDRFKRNKIECYVAAYAERRDAALIQAPMDKIDAHGRILGSNVEPRKHVIEHLNEIYRQQDVDFYYPTSALAFSRSYLENVLPLDFSDGCALWIDTRLSIVAPYYGRVLTLPETLTEWRRHSESDSIRARSRNLQIRQTLMRTTVFNCFCRRQGLRTISAWRNTRFYRQLLRFSLPELAYDIYYNFLKPRGRRPVRMS
jgi:glycosyltransferase involved in cell wall biosynthesis